MWRKRVKKKGGIAAVQAASEGIAQVAGSRTATLNPKPQTPKP